VENPYLQNLRSQYLQLKKSIEGLQARASGAKRDLTQEELRSVIEMGEQAKTLYDQIESLSEIELRNAQVDAMNAKVASAMRGGGEDDGTGGDDSGDGTGGDTGSGTGNGQFRTLGGAKTQDRDPGLYVRGGQHSFVADQFRSAKMGDTEAAKRLMQHSNALRDNAQLRDVLGAGATTFGAGLVPPVWLAEQFAPILHRKLRLASMLRQGGPVRLVDPGGVHRGENLIGCGGCQHHRNRSDVCHPDRHPQGDHGLQRDLPPAAGGIEPGRGLHHLGRPDG
jgi:hypothetical protein